VAGLTHCFARRAGGVYCAQQTNVNRNVRSPEVGIPVGASLDPRFCPHAVYGSIQLMEHQTCCTIRHHPTHLNSSSSHLHRLPIYFKILSPSIEHEAVCKPPVGDATHDDNHVVRSPNTATASPRVAAQATEVALPPERIPGCDSVPLNCHGRLPSQVLRAHCTSLSHYRYEMRPRTSRCRVKSIAIPAML